MKPFDTKELRSAFGSFITGVAVVTARRADGEAVGFTANSFTSVSLDPPLLLVCPGRLLSSYETFCTCTHFAVNILSDGQEDVANVFAGYKGDRFGKIPHHLDLHGVPLIDNASSQFSCTRHEAIPMGDHCLLVGRVVAFTNSTRLGLGYGAGRLLKISQNAAARQDTLERI